MINAQIKGRMEAGRLQAMVTKQYELYGTIRPLELKRFCEIYRSPQALFEIEVTDLLLEPECLARMFICGGMKWLNALLEKAKELSDGSVPIRFNNAMNKFREDLVVVPSSDLAELIFDSLIDPLLVIGEDVPLKHMLDFFAITVSNELHLNGLESMMMAINKYDDVSMPDETRTYTYSIDTGNKVVILRAEHLNEDITSNTFL